MPSLPPFDIHNKTTDAPHVVILGAGASLAAFPNGDANGLQLPLMRNLVGVVGLGPLLIAHGLLEGWDDFESLYDALATSGRDPALQCELELQIRAYFERMKLPSHATIYDLLILSLREKDLIATFNWDPFLAQAYRRNRHLRRLPSLAFLHGNVEVGSCQEHKRMGFIEQRCSICAKQFDRSALLFPVRQKNYTSDPFIHGEWERLRTTLSRAYLVTIFGYSAPATDAAAKALMLENWNENPTRNFAEIEIIDVRPREELETAWKEFFVRQHYGIVDSADRTFAFRHVRRSCEAFAMATLQMEPWRENPFPPTLDLTALQAWLEPLLSACQKTPVF